MAGGNHPQWGIVLNIWPDEPVVHRYDGDTREGQNTRWTDYTRCGRKIGAYKPWLPFKHTLKFARPCKGCFPEGV